MAVNVKGVFLGLRHVLPVMLKQARRGGEHRVGRRFGGLTGHAGLRGIEARGHRFDQTAAGEVARSGIRVNAVCPGPIDTSMIHSLESTPDPADPGSVGARYQENIPIGRYGTADEVANLCSSSVPISRPTSRGAICRRWRQQGDRWRGHQQFGSLMQTVRTATLEIAYEESGPADGPPVILLHGWPPDPHDWDGVAPQLPAGGCRVLVPWLRGYGPTRFRDPAAPRSGQQAALGSDLKDFMDALGMGRRILAGYDWGGRAACIVAALWPERVRGLVSIGGYNIQSIATPAPGRRRRNTGSGTSGISTPSAAAPG